MEEDYVKCRWENDIPVNKAQYVIKQISPEESDVEYLPGVTISMFVEKTKELILKLTQDKKLAVYPTLIEGEFHVKQKELEEAFQKYCADGEAKAKEVKNKPLDKRKENNYLKIIGVLITNYCKVNPHFKYPHLTSYIENLLSNFGLKVGTKSIKKNLRPSFRISSR